MTRRCKYLFFGTARRGHRVLSGYYRIRWYTHGSLGDTDICLAADKARFVSEPIPFTEVDALCGTDISQRFRGLRLLSAEHSGKLLQLINSRPDATGDYLQEIDRMERFNLRYGGYRYVGWKQGDVFSWDKAATYLQKWAGGQDGLSVLNSSPSGIWGCTSCRNTLKNKALLKRCPNCGALGSLRPTEEP